MQKLSYSNNRYIKHLDLGLIEYTVAWDLQTRMHKALIARKRPDHYPEGDIQIPENEHYFITCEHPPVFTLGKSGSEANLLLTADELIKAGITYNKINRGGDITYHGPGQIVGYPILDLDHFFTDVHKYVRSLEEVIIRTLSEFGVQGHRDENYTGVWVRFDEPPFYRKICAIGVHLSRWVTLHGFAFNINNDLSPFSFIIPCGISEENRGVCNLIQLIGEPIDTNIVINHIIKYFSAVFDVNIYKADTADLIC